MAKAAKKTSLAESALPPQAQNTPAPPPPLSSLPPVSPLSPAATPPSEPPIPTGVVADEKGLAKAVSAIRVPKLPKVYGAYDKKKDAIGHMRGKLNDTLRNPTRGDILSTGILGVDILLGAGVNFGSVHEVYGKSKGGKTYLIQRLGAMCHAQYDDSINVYYDRENAYDHMSLAAQGNDPARTIIVPPSAIPTPVDLWNKNCELMAMLAAGAPLDEVGEVAKLSDPTVEVGDDGKKRKVAKSFGNARRITKATPHLYLGVDSAPAFAEQEDMITDQGRRAKEWHAFFRRFTGVLDSRLMMVISNHIIYKPGIYGNPESKTSGLALDYYRDCGIKCMNVHEMYNANGMQNGNMLGIEVEKSRRGGTGGHTCFPVFNNGGVGYFSGILPVAEQFGLVKIANQSIFKDKKALGRVWVKYEYVSDKRYIMSEENPEELAAMLQTSGLLAAIQKYAAENLSYTA